MLQTIVFDKLVKMIKYIQPASSAIVEWYVFSVAIDTGVLIVTETHSLRRFV